MSTSTTRIQSIESRTCPIAQIPNFPRPYFPSLKPENILLDKDGYIRVADFGLSRRNVTSNFSANSMCGTPEYLAPEVIFKMGHGKPVDWWAIGCIIYELLVGIPPFYCKTKEELFEKIKFGKIKYPIYVSDTSQDIISKLMLKNPGRRLGTKNGAAEIKEHEFFKGLNWEALFEKKVLAPFIPLIQEETDITNFATVSNKLVQLCLVIARNSLSNPWNRCKLTSRGGRFLKGPRSMIVRSKCL